MSIARPNSDLIPGTDLRVPLIPAENKLPEVKMAVAPSPEEIQRTELACQKAGANVLNLGRDKFISTQTLLQMYFTRSPVSYGQVVETQVNVDLLTTKLMVALKKESENSGDLDTYRLWTETNGFAGMMTTIGLIVHCCNAQYSIPMALTCGGLSWLMEKLVFLCSAHQELRDKIDNYQEKLSVLNKLLKQQEEVFARNEMPVRDGSDQKITEEDYQKIFTAHQAIRKLLKEKDAFNAFLINIENEINFLKLNFPGVKPASLIMRREDGPPAARIRVPALSVLKMGDGNEQKFAAEMKNLLMENEGCSNIDIDTVLLRRNPKLIALGILIGSAISSFAWTLPVGKVTAGVILKIVLEFVKTNYQAGILGICGGALAGHVGDRMNVVKNLKYSIVPRINELLQVAIDANQALKTNNAEIQQQGDIIRKLKCA